MITAEAAGPVSALRDRPCYAYARQALNPIFQLGADLYIGPIVALEYAVVRDLSGPIPARHDRHGLRYYP